MKDYTDITENITNVIRKLKNEIPETIDGFYALNDSASQQGALSAKTKELIALAIAVAGHCDGCIGFHTHKLVRLEATKKEVAEALGVAIYMGGGPSLMYAAEAYQAFNEFCR